MALALIFGVLTLTLVANQVATGLALTIFGIGLSALIGDGFVGIPDRAAAQARHPRPVATSRSSARSCSATTSWSTSRSR